MWAAFILLGAISIVVSIVIFGSEDYGMWIFIAGVLMVLGGILWPAIMIRNEPKKEKPKSAVIETEVISLEECKKNKFCEVDEVHVLRVCNSNGCTLLEDTITLSTAVNW